MMDGQVPKWGQNSGPNVPNYNLLDHPQVMMATTHGPEDDARLILESYSNSNLFGSSNERY
jgi:hypothetical protein